MVVKKLAISAHDLYNNSPYYFFIHLNHGKYLLLMFFATYHTINQNTWSVKKQQFLHSYFAKLF